MKLKSINLNYMWPLNTSGTQPKSIDYQSLESILRKMAGLKREERLYVLEAFKKYRSGGITKREIESVVRELGRTSDDPVSPNQARRIGKELISHL